PSLQDQEREPEVGKRRRYDQVRHRKGPHRGVGPEDATQWHTRHRDRRDERQERYETRKDEPGLETPHPTHRGKEENSSRAGRGRSVGEGGFPSLTLRLCCYGMSHEVPGNRRRWAAWARPLPAIVRRGRRSRARSRGPDAVGFAGSYAR